MLTRIVTWERFSLSWFFLWRIREVFFTSRDCLSWRKCRSMIKTRFSLHSEVSVNHRSKNGPLEKLFTATGKGKKEKMIFNIIKFGNPNARKWYSYFSHTLPNRTDSRRMWGCKAAVVVLCEKKKETPTSKILTSTTINIKSTCFSMASVVLLQPRDPSRNALSPQQRECVVWQALATAAKESSLKCLEN